MPPSDDLILYTVTIDAVVRIFLPVLDSPQFLQLHASLDLWSAIPSNHLEQMSSTVFWLDREVVGTVLDHILAQSSEEDDTPTRRIREMRDERWDLFLRVLQDGSVIVTAVAVSSPTSFLRCIRHGRLYPGNRS